MQITFNDSDVEYIKKCLKRLNCYGTIGDDSQRLRVGILLLLGELSGLMDTDDDNIKGGIVPDFDDYVSFMDDDLRELLHDLIAPCTQYFFLTAYKRLHYLKYGEEFEI